MPRRDLYSAIFLTMFAVFSLWAFSPALRSFFDPQDFITFLNPGKADTPYLQFLKEGWSWQNDQGELVGFFRPLPSTMYLLEYQFFGFSAAAYKAVTFLLHLACSLLVAMTVFSLTGRKTIAAWGGMIFALHPGTAGAVAIIVTRPDIIATLFSILAVRSALQLGRKEEFSHASLLPALYTALALSGKELGVANLFALPLVYFLWASGKRNRKNTLYFIFSLLLVGVLFFAVRFHIFGNVGGYETRPPLSSSLAWVPAVVSQAVGIAYFTGPLKIVVVLMELLLIAAFLVRKGWKGFRELSLAILITGIYSFQSLLSFPEPHYVYVSAAFTTIFFGYFFSSLRLGTKGWKPVASFVAVIAIAGFATRREAVMLDELTEAKESVYRGLEAVTPELSGIDPEECYVVISRNSAEGLEMKNVPLYMTYIDRVDCDLILTDRIIYSESGAPLLIWNGEEVELVRGDQPFR